MINTDEFKDQLKDELGGLGKKIAILILCVVIALVPVSPLNPVPRVFLSGSAQVNNRYVAFLQSYRDDARVAHDKMWMGEFEAASDELISFNEKVFRYDLDRVSTDGSIFFIGNYAAATYEQIQAIEKISFAVHMGDRASYVNGTSWFDQTIDDQLSAIMQGSAYYQSRPVATIIHILPNAVRFYGSMLGYRVLSLILALCGAALMIYAVFRYRSVYVAGNVSLGTIRYLDGNEVKNEKEKREEGKREVLKLSICFGAVFVLIVSIVTCISASVARDSGENDTAKYMELVAKVAIEAPYRIGYIASNSQYDQEEKIQILSGEVIEGMEAVEAIREWQDVPEDYTTLHSNLLIVLEDVYGELADMQSYLQNGAMCPDELLSDYVHSSEELVRLSGEILSQYGIRTMWEVLDG